MGAFLSIGQLSVTFMPNGVPSAKVTLFDYFANCCTFYEPSVNKGARMPRRHLGSFALEWLFVRCWVCG
nr:MAG TPA: hypothetical protein [Crassvirales sp.]